MTSGAIGVRKTWSAENGGSVSANWRNVEPVVPRVATALERPREGLHAVARERHDDERAAPQRETSRSVEPRGPRRGTRTAASHRADVSVAPHADGRRRGATSRCSRSPRSRCSRRRASSNGRAPTTPRRGTCRSTSRSATGSSPARCRTATSGSSIRPARSRRSSCRRSSRATAIAVYEPELNDAAESYARVVCDADDAAARGDRRLHGALARRARRARRPRRRWRWGSSRRRRSSSASSR